MGLIGAVLGSPAATASIGKAAAEVAEVFVPNATRKMQAGHDAWMASMNEFGEEFRQARTGWFDRFVDGLNRLPRPMLAFGTLGLFVYAMVDPGGFSLRMQGLNYVPEPLWWLLAAIVGFYFGAREAHHFRSRVPAPPRGAPGAPAAGPGPDAPGHEAPAERPGAEGGGAGEIRTGEIRTGEIRAGEIRAGENAALDDWRTGMAGRG
ncbi:MAG: holin family protein [Paracoccaceae bacterium]